jgi:hypothetical protein
MTKAFHSLKQGLAIIQTKGKKKWLITKLLDIIAKAENDYFHLSGLPGITVGSPFSEDYLRRQIVVRGVKRMPTFAKKLADTAQTTDWRHQYHPSFDRLLQY